MRLRILILCVLFQLQGFAQELVKDAALPDNTRAYRIVHLNNGTLLFVLFGELNPFQQDSISVSLSLYDGYSVQPLDKKLSIAREDAEARPPIRVMIQAINEHDYLFSFYGQCFYKWSSLYGTVEEAKVVTKKSDIDQLYCLRKDNEGVYALGRKGNKLYEMEWQNKGFVKKGEVGKLKNVRNNFLNYLRLKDFKILSIKEQETIILNEQFKRVRTLNPDDFNKKNNTSAPFFFYSIEAFQGSARVIPGFASQTMYTITSQEVSKSKQQIEKAGGRSYLHTDAKGNLCILKWGVGSKLIHSISGEEVFIPYGKCTMGLLVPDYFKDFYLFDGLEVKRIAYQDKHLTHYETKESTRSFFPLFADSIYLVTSESGKAFRFNYKKNTLENFDFTENGKKTILGSVRNCQGVDDHSFWINTRDEFVLATKQGNIIKRLKAQSEVQAWLLEDEVIYYGTHHGGLYKLDVNQGKETIIQNQENYYTQDLIKNHDTLWVATDVGMRVYNTNGLDLSSRIKIPEKLKRTPIFCLLKQDEMLWAGSSTGALFKWSKADGQLEIVAGSQELNKQPIADLMLDNFQNLWVMTYKGLFVVNTKDTKTQTFPYQAQLKHIEFNRYSAYKTTHGKIFLGSVQGFHLLDETSNSITESNGHHIYLNTITTYDKDGNKQSQYFQSDSTVSIELTAAQAFLSLTFFQNNIHRSSTNQFLYKLGDKNGEWKEFKTPNELEFEILPPGHHTIYVKGLDESGRYSDNQIKVQIYVADFFYKTWWFLSLLFLGAFALFYYFYNQLKERNRLQSQLSQNLILGQEEERTRLAKELHDGIGQQLVLLKRKSQNKGEEELSKLTGVVLEDMRSITRDLYPATLSSLGLTKAIVSLVDVIDAEHDVFFIHDIAEVDEQFSKESELNLYRFIQECLSNIIKHAQASSVEIDLSKLENNIKLSIKDNGKGFDVDEKLRSSSSLGMKTLQERIKILGGTFEIESAPNKGTNIHVTIPFK